MADFDAQDIIQPAAPKKKAVKSDFAQEDVIQTAPGSDFDAQDVIPPAGQTSGDQNLGLEDVAYRDVQKTIERPFLSAPKLISESTTTDEIDAIARQHKVDPSVLREMAPYFGALGPGSTGQELESSLARGVGFNVPQFVAKKTLDDPNMRAAVDDLQRLADSKRSLGRGLAENLIPVGALGRVIARGAESGAQKLATRAAIRKAAVEGAGIGTVAGLANSREGEELEGAVMGGTTGGVLGGVVATATEFLPKLFSRSGRITEAEQELIAKNRDIDIGGGIQDVADRSRESEQLIDDLIFGEKPSLTQGEAQKIVDQQIGPEGLQKYMDSSSDEGHLYSGAKGEVGLVRNLADDVLTARARDFAEDLVKERPTSFEKAVQVIRDWSSREGVEATHNRYLDFVTKEQGQKWLRETSNRTYDQPGFVGRALNWISDNQFVLRHFDDKFGTDLEGILRQANKAFNRSTFALQHFRNDLSNIFRDARKLGTDESVVNTDKIYRALDTGDVSQLTPQEQQTAQSFRKYFDDIRDFVNRAVKEKDPNIAPLNIPYLANYVPKQMKSIPEVIGIMEQKVDAVQKLAGVDDLSKLTKEQYNQIASRPETQELVRFTQMFDPKPFTSPQDFADRVKSLLYSRDGNVALETRARAAMERTGEIPEYLLEKNLYKLADKYNANTMRHLFLRNSLDKLRYQAKVLRSAKGDVEAKYVENMVQDALGVRKGTAAEAYLQARINAARALDGMIARAGKDSRIGGMLTGVKSLPEGLYTMTRLMYPNVLGYFNPRAVMQNATQSLTKVWPELGVQYGGPVLARALAHTVLNFRELLAKARSEGNMPAEFSRSGKRAMAEGIQRSALWEIPAKTLDGLADFGMSLYKASENVNRAITMSVGEMMAADLARGSDAARKSLAKFPRTVQQAVIESKSQTDAARILSQYLNDATQYNYNRLSLSEFGRTMGPLFSAFSKWPTATAGDVIYEMRNKPVMQAAVRLGEKYLAPLVALQAIDMSLGEGVSFLGEDYGGDGLSDRKKKLLGSSGLSQSAPLGSLGAIAKGEIFTPPVVDAVMKGVILPMWSGDTAKLQHGAASAIQNFTPGAGLVRFLTDDAVTLATGQRPEGSDFFERAQEGARIIRKETK